MLTFLQSLSWSRWLLSIVDVAIVAYGFYRLFLLIRGTRAVQLIKGIAVLLLAVPVSQWLQLNATHAILQDIQVMLTVALPIVFQPELRRALEQIGQGRFFAEPLVSHEEVDMVRVIDEVARATERLSQSRTGALIVLERQTGLREYAATGIPMEALVSAPLLENIFVPNTPLHDGACIIRGDRVVAAAAFLPLTESARPGSELGSRHRAALGITEQSDAVAVVVSEETGWISVAVEGHLTRRLEDRTLREMLLRLFRRKPHPGLKLWIRGAGR
ncbi:MAG: diadenylate cyclase CdaA [Actinomycetia bacterium]|nr:diadenylate cyclase CdaA [Actinomycetes bacterium]